MLKNDQLDKAQARQIERESSSVEQFAHLLSRWEDWREERRFREDVIGTKFSDRHGRQDRIVKDSVNITKNLIDNMVEIISGDFDGEKVTLYEFCYIDDDLLKFKTDIVRKYAKQALKRHYDYLSSEKDEITRERVDQAVDQTISEDESVLDGIRLPEYYLTWIREHQREESIT